MSVKFDVKITEKHIYDFQLYHGRMSWAGLLGKVAATLGLAYAAYVLIAPDQLASNALIWIAFSLIVLIFPRQQLKTKAKMQVKNSDMFHKPLSYEFSEHGITTRQEGLEVTNQWDAVVKAVSTKKSILLYMSRVRAIIFPKECLGEYYDEVVRLIRENVPEKQVKIK